MPREIDCPECIELKKVNKQIDEAVEENFGYCPNESYVDDLLDKMYRLKDHKTCKDGKVKVYTKEELHEAIKQEREECALECESVGNLSPVIRPATKICAEAIRERE